MESENSIIDIGPECFIDAKRLVISYKGQNYYCACDAFMRNLPSGGSSFCVKRKGHSTFHEDYDGYAYDPYFEEKEK